MSQPRVPSKRVREIRRAIELATEELASDYSIEMTSGTHVCVTLRRKGQSRKVFTGLTPSDHRAFQNFKSNLRRAWTDLGGRVIGD